MTDNYRYPTPREVAEDIRHETTAISVAISALDDALATCPLKDHVKVYAALELALRYADSAYVEEVLNEIIIVRSMK